MTFSFYQDHLQFRHEIYLMLLNVCTKNEVYRFSRILNMDNCMVNTSLWRHPPFDFYEILMQICKGHTKAAYQILDWSNIRELKYLVGKLTKNHEEKWIFSHCDLDIWSKVTNFNRVWDSMVSNRLAKTASKSVHPFGWNFVHKQSRTHTQTNRQTDRHTDKQQWK